MNFEKSNSKSVNTVYSYIYQRLEFAILFFSNNNLLQIFMRKYKVALKVFEIIKTKIFF